jgi:hypothetical protein
LNAFWSQKLAHVSAVPVQLAGKWSVTATLRLGGGHAITRRWEGLAKADHSLVAVSFLVKGNSVQWGKSDPQAPAGACEVDLALFPHDNIGLKVQVNIVVGNGGYRRNTTRVASVTYLPEVPDLQEIACGQLLRLATINGDPVIEVGLMFLPRAEVRKGRTGNWKPREPSPDASLLSKILVGPRAGTANLVASAF